MTAPTRTMASQAAQHRPNRMASVTAPDEWLTVEEVCAELKISRRTFDRRRGLVLLSGDGGLALPGDGVTDRALPAGSDESHDHLTDGLDVGVRGVSALRPPPGPAVAQSSQASHKQSGVPDA